MSDPHENNRCDDTEAFSKADYGAAQSWQGVEPEPSAPLNTFHSLDPRVIGLWRLRYAIGFTVLLLFALVAALIGSMSEPAIYPWVVAGWLFLVGVFAFLTYWRPPRLYRAWGYRIDGKVLETRSGLVFRINKLLPLSRLQHVDLHRGPLERIFGLASLVLHTAGTSQAQITIPGLEANLATRLRDHLVEVGGDDAV